MNPRLRCLSRDLPKSKMTNANHPLNTEARFASKHGPNSETIPLSERRKSGPNFGTTSPLKYETSDEPQIGSTARAISGLSVDTMPATVAQMVWESRSGPKAEELKSVTISVTKSKTNIETNAEITAAVPAPKSDLTSTLEHESTAEMPEPRFTPKSKMTNANHPLNTEARFASKRGSNSETMPELKSETDENKSESTHAISGMSTDSISATATETVWKSRAGLKAEKLKSVTISIPESRASVATNAEMTAAVSGPEFDLTSKLKFESMTQMPEPKLKTTSRISAANNQRGSELRSEPPKSEQITKAEL